jgi:hypothetical protein
VVSTGGGGEACELGVGTNWMEEEIEGGEVHQVRRREGGLQV